jgi:hypothetical protein
MKKSTSITDFIFFQIGYGTYKVYYTSPVTGRQWSVLTHDMPLIDSTKNSDEPTQICLNRLKKLCKSNEK